MGVCITPSTLDGGYTPICNACGATEHYDISHEEYRTEQRFWDRYECGSCTEHRSLKRFFGPYGS